MLRWLLGLDADSDDSETYQSQRKDGYHHQAIYETRGDETRFRGRVVIKASDRCSRCGCRSCNCR